MKKLRALERKITITCKHCDHTRETTISGPDRDLNYHCGRCFNFLWDKGRIIGITCLCGDRFYPSTNSSSSGMGDDE